MKLKFEAMQVLMEQLQQSELWAFYLMAIGEEMTEKVTKAHLTNIIRVLCKNLKWIDEVNQGDPVNNHENTFQSGKISSDLCKENVSTQPGDTLEYTPTKDESANYSQEDLGNKKN